ncbi:hypothetical protein BC939DRAFT_525652 [Gamsiella multidivaricata]|uniref:uncharacterized protein n=1 Tax=Gamsiella multidivaricata TaxID=101098 RepID=UPI00221F4959|nr:uncharacterized protein BC939DRAFT_525652 [Gamsiella multidivaricata]KAI7830454.1 hypothetical protein BC939DRAFT_525652 [Gamsiella multidivaricata]
MSESVGASAPAVSRRPDASGVSNPFLATNPDTTLDLKEFRLLAAIRYQQESSAMCMPFPVCLFRPSCPCFTLKYLVHVPYQPREQSLEAVPEPLSRTPLAGDLNTLIQLILHFAHSAPPPSSAMTSELILYLEPARFSTLWTQLQSFFLASQSQPWSENEAARYPAHVTMVRFFDDPSPTTTTTTTKDRLIEYLGQHIHQISLASAPSSRVKLRGLLRPRPDLLLIAIEPPTELLDMMQAWKDAFPELELRLKKINHLSLCYWDEQETQRKRITAKEMDQRVEWTDRATGMVQECIPMSQADTPGVNESWDIVLYSIQGRDKSDGLPYPLVELARWALA